MQEKTDDAVIEKDLLLIYVEDKPAFFARVESFTADHKPGWWHVKLLILQVPPLITTWILRRPQFNGEPFTMGGTPIRIEKVRVPEETQTQADKLAPEPPAGDAPPAEKPVEAAGHARILSLGRERPQKSGD